LKYSKKFVGDLVMDVQVLIVYNAADQQSLANGLATG
jgi:hypothetical protein